MKRSFPGSILSLAASIVLLLPVWLGYFHHHEHRQGCANHCCSTAGHQQGERNNSGFDVKCLVCDQLYSPVSADKTVQGRIIPVMVIAEQPGRAIAAPAVLTASGVHLRAPPDRML